jgi:pullulanase
MLDYHINGFRFDLMGLHSKETMSEIYKELSAIDSNVLVYGEPWTGGDARVKNGCTGSVPSEAYGVGAFDDDFRDAIKGAEFGGFNAGEVQGVYNSDGISAGLIGESGKNSRNPTDFIGLGLHYVECHDNFTLFDKLVYSLKDNIDAVKEADDEGKIATKWPATITLEQIELIKKEQTLAGAYVMLSQGTAFMNGGQEFLRTKKGNPDSYSADTKGGVKWTNDAGDKNIDDVNTINLTFKETYSDVYKTYKGLIAFRKQYSSLFGSFTETNVQKAKDLNKDRVDGVTKYRVDGTTDKFLIYFNATEKEFVPLADDIKDYTKVIDVTSGTPTESTTLPASVPAKSFVILKK